MFATLITSEKAKVDGDAILTQLDRVSSATRRRMFEALFPSLGEYVEAAWQQIHEQPYQDSWHRKAFRAPNDPSVTSSLRLEWLERLLHALVGYEEGIDWVAAWAPHLPRYGSEMQTGRLLAAAIDARDELGERVFEILCQSARGEHEIGRMGRHIPIAFLTSSRPEAWDFIERMLLAAQREEGLRQSVLEVVDLAHPEAFRRMLRLILEHDLVRFSSVVRAMDVWLGFHWDSASAGVVKRTIERLLALLGDEDRRRDAISDGEPELCYLGLWASAYYDAPRTVPQAVELLHDSQVERRFVAVELLGLLGLRDACLALLPALDDPDLRIVANAIKALSGWDTLRVHDTDLLDRLERLAPRLPRRKKKLPAIVWPWAEFSLEKSSASRLFEACIGLSTLDRLQPCLKYMDARARTALARLLKESRTAGKQGRELLLELASDASSYVRREAFEAIKKQKITVSEAPAFESLLSRKASDIRRAAVELLLTLPDADVLASADRLIASPDSQQRAAGFELLRQMKEYKRATGEIKKRTAAIGGEVAAASRTEQQQVEALRASNQPATTLDNCLGLLDPKVPRTQPITPKAKSIVLVTDGAIRCIQSLDDLINEYRETPVTVHHADGKIEQRLLGEQWVLSHPSMDATLEETLPELPLRELWEEWWKQRPTDLRDKDHFELLRARGILEAEGRRLDRSVSGALARLLREEGRQRRAIRAKLSFPHAVKNLVTWLLVLHPSEGMVPFALDAMETSFASVPPNSLRYVPGKREWEQLSWRYTGSYPYMTWLEVVHLLWQFCRDHWTPSDHLRFWRLLRWRDEPPGASLPRERCGNEFILEACRRGVANKNDLLDHLIGPREREGYGYGCGSFFELQRLTRRTPPPEVQQDESVRRIISQCRDRILEIELERGELPTAASGPALYLSSIRGAETLVRILVKSSECGFVRGWSHHDESKPAVFSHLVRVAFPAADDSPQQFERLVREAQISESRLLEVALFVPHWAAFVEAAVGWTGLDETCWWLHAHTKDRQWQIDQETRELWAAEISRRTPLSAEDLVDGAADVEWFGRVHGLLGERRWLQLEKLAKFASTGTGHARAALFARAMLGRLNRDELIARVREKRHKDSARALGLLPLAEGKRRQADLLERYEVLQEFLRTSKKFGAQRRASEKRAVEVGLENLARTAGFADPLRLQWAMEIESLRDLANGAIAVTDGDTTVRLSIDADGVPEIAAEKKGKPLKAIQPALKKKSAAVAELAERKTQLKRQRSRIRTSLEEAMCGQDEFSADELVELMKHPMLAPALKRLVLIGEMGTGYPRQDGKAIVGPAGEEAGLPRGAKVRIAHPHDLFKAGKWQEWQRDCFAAERIQPFKQVFRELYMLTDIEKREQTESPRYAGHQVNPRQALGTLGSRGWVHHRDEGVSRTFHRDGFSAWINFDQYFTTPSEVEGLTVRSVHFSRRGEWKPVRLEEIPPRLFSETMRDVDLMVSVAHRGGVDPEATASTMEMRAALIRETCAFMKHDNVRLNNSHAMVDGQIGNYSVHLGSGVVHRMPGGMLCIVPVHAQHRGRLFLPFADDDPRTAEVLSKILLLAEDAKIKDPTILEQLRAS